MRGQRRSFWVSALLLVCAVTYSETVAISVRPMNFLEESTDLVLAAEQGIMDQFFGAGHIVFDLEIDPEDEVYGYRAIDSARDGGANIACIVEIEFLTTTARGLIPGWVSVSVLDVETEETTFTATLQASKYPGSEDLTPGALAEALGAGITVVALSGLNGGSGW